MKLKLKNLKASLSAICIEILLFCLFATFAFSSQDQHEYIQVDHFTKVIVSPHIEVVFVENESEAVIIEDSKISLDKINVNVTGSTLRIYLDQAQIVSKREKVKRKKYNTSKPIYNGKIATIKVHYKELNELSLRGEQRFVCESKLEQEKFVLKIYGEAEVVLNEVNLKTLKTAIYGESSLDIRKGQVKKQTYTTYGESEVNANSISNEETKIISHGEGDFKVHTDEKLRVSAFGEANVRYSGNPDIHKGIIIGEISIEQMLN